MAGQHQCLGSIERFACGHLRSIIVLSGLRVQHLSQILAPWWQQIADMISACKPRRPCNSKGSRVTAAVRGQGILSPYDAVRALEAKVDGLILSNHGGRQLDYAPTVSPVSVPPLSPGNAHGWGGPCRHAAAARWALLASLWIL